MFYSVFEKVILTHVLPSKLLHPLPTTLMKVLRVSQDILRRATFRTVKLKIRSDLMIEAGPKIVHPLNRKNEEKKWLGWLLPEGYPQSVHDNYLKFSAWTGLQGISASFIGVLSTQAMLGTLMSISGNGDGWLSKGTAAATINWILKDGLGQAGGIALVSLLGSRLDNQARFLRFHSTVLFLIGSLLEFSIPFACISASDPNTTFLLFASTANILKNVSWMVVSATRAHFMKNFALKDNLGDLTGKAASQMTLSSLIGTGLGLAVLKAEEGVIGKNLLIAGCWTVSAIIGLMATRKSCKVALSRQLTPQRIFKLVETLSKHKINDKTQMARYVWTPEILAARENFVLPQKSLITLIMNAPLNTLAESSDVNWIIDIEEIDVNKFCAARIDDKMYIWTLESATATDKLVALLTVALSHYQSELDGKVVLEALQRQGWDIANFSCKELDDKSRALTIEKNKEA